MFKLLFLLILSNYLCLSYAQPWDKNFYEEKVLYDNADLLQLTEYEKLRLKYKYQKESELLDTNSSTYPTEEFYDFSDSDQDKKKKKNQLISFKSMSNYVSENTPATGNISEDSDTYFIDF